MAAGVRPAEAQRVPLDQCVPDVRATVRARTDVHARVAEATRVHVVEAAADGVRGEQSVASGQTRVVRGQVIAPPAVRADHAALVTAVPPDFVAVLAVLCVVEVADGQVLDPNVRGLFNLDPVAERVASVDDHEVPIHPAQVQLRRPDHDLFAVDARRDEHPVARLGCVHGRLDRFVMPVGRVLFCNDERRARMCRRERGEQADQERKQLAPEAI